MRRIFLLLFGLFITFSLSAQSKKLKAIDELLFQEKYPQAIEQLKRLIQKGDGTAMVNYRLGRAYLILQNPCEAIRYLEKAKQLDSLSIPIMQALSNGYLSSGMYPNAQKTLEWCRKLDTTDLQTNLLLAKAYTSQRMYKKSFQVYNQLCESDTLNSYYHRQKGMIAEKMNYIPLAFNEFVKAYQLNPKDILTLTKLTTLLNQMGMYEVAIKYCNQGLDIYPENSILLRKKATILINLRWFENALSILEKLRQKDQCNAKSLKQLALCYMHEKEYNKALSALDPSSPSFENDPMVNLYLGIIHLKLNNTGEALKFLQKAQKVGTPGYLGSIYLYKAKTYGQTREFAKAIDAYKEHWKLDDSDPIILYEIATTLEELGKHKKEAMSYYIQFINQYQGKNKRRVEYSKERIMRIKEKIHFEK